MRIITCSYFLNTHRLRVRWKDDNETKFHEYEVMKGGESAAAAKCMEIAICTNKYTIIAPDEVLKYIPQNLRSKH